MLAGFVRLALSVWVAATITFVAFQFLPGDALSSQLLAAGIDPSALDSRREVLGLDAPVFVQYLRYIGGVLVGNLGVSLLDGLPVTNLIFQRLWITASIAIPAGVLGCSFGLAIGILGSIRNRWLSECARAVTNLLVVVPAFWSATLLLTLIALVHQSAPGVLEADSVLWPVLVLAASIAGPIGRVALSLLRESEAHLFIVTAQSKGLSQRRILWTHRVRYVLAPVLTVMGLQVGFLLSGTVVVESIFARGGLGRLLLDRTINQDYPVVAGVVIVVAIIYGTILALTHMLTPLLDPRVSRG